MSKKKIKRLEKRIEQLETIASMLAIDAANSGLNELKTKMLSIEDHDNNEPAPLSTANHQDSE